MSHHEHDNAADNAPVTYGLLAELAGPTELVKAARQIRDAGYKRWDAHSPFPVHGLDPSMGIKPTILPWIVLGAGLSGLGLALLMQWWMNAIDYPYVISGKPIFSLPANIPVIFELTVLLSGVTCFLAVLMLSLLPEHYHPLLGVERMKRATQDGFFISIEAADPLFNERTTAELLKKAGAKSVELVSGAPKSAGKLPKALIYIGIVAVVATFLPLAIVADARWSKSREPKVHLVFDMDHQPKLKAQAASHFFADGHGFRPPVEGTVAAGELRADDHFERGVVNGAWATELPAQIQLTDATMQRGQERFGIYCSPCHGHAGAGDGMVARRAAELGEGTWVPPTSMHAANVREQAAGQLFNTITHGVRNMPGYSAQIPVADRWAIVLYVEALQRSQYAQLTDVPADVQSTLR